MTYLLFYCGNCLQSVWIPNRYEKTYTEHYNACPSCGKDMLKIKVEDNEPKTNMRPDKDTSD